MFPGSGGTLNAEMDAWTSDVQGHRHRSLVPWKGGTPNAARDASNEMGRSGSSLSCAMFPGMIVLKMLRMKDIGRSGSRRSVAPCFPLKWMDVPHSLIVLIGRTISVSKEMNRQSLGLVSGERWCVKLLNIYSASCDTSRCFESKDETNGRRLPRVNHFPYDSVSSGAAAAAEPIQFESK